MGTSKQDEMSKNGANWIEADAYLFDIDGTLLNTRDAVHYYAFLNAIRDVFGVEPSIDGVPVHGNTDIGILRAVVTRAGMPPAEFEARLPRALQQMCAEVETYAAHMQAELCPSVEQLLQTLSQAGKLLGVASGNLQSIGWAKLQAAGLRSYFDFGSFSDQAEFRSEIFRNAVAEARKRLGGSARVCVVGDTPSDIKAARQLNLPIIAVATGIYSRDQLLAYDPDVCVPCCSDLLPCA